MPIPQFPRPSELPALPQMVKWHHATAAAQVERWENVIRVLESLSPHEREKHWDMGDWVDLTECGTVACAAGHCGMDAWFQSQGFYLRFYGVYVPFGEDAEKYDGWAAQMTDPSAFFGVIGADRIFYNTTARSVEVVLEEVKRYVAELKARSP